jgi:protein-tyrosine phosphatase
MAPVRILFVCMGNICRSPAAECVFRKRAESRGLGALVDVDSAGTTGYHAGDLPDARITEAGRKRGYVISGTSRQVTARDLETFDLIIAMDMANLRELHRLDRDGGARDKIHLFLDFHHDPPFREVPDPYYGGPEGFHKVLDLVESASDGLLNMLTRKEP